MFYFWNKKEPGDGYDVMRSCKCSSSLYRINQYVPITATRKLKKQTNRLWILPRLEFDHNSNHTNAAVPTFQQESIIHRIFNFVVDSTSTVNIERIETVLTRYSTTSLKPDVMSKYEPFLSSILGRCCQNVVTNSN